MSVKTVEASLLLLELISRRDQPSGVSDLARELSLPKANVFRLLGTLVDRGFVKQRDDSRYEPSLKMWELGCAIVSRASLTQEARPVLDRLAASSGESAQLAVLDGAESIYIDKRDGPHPISGFTRIGTRAPAHCCATGKVELAMRGPEAVQHLPERLPAFTPATITSRNALDKVLESIRAQAVAVNRGEWVADVWGVASAIRNSGGGVCASIGLWGPKQRVANELPRLMDLVQDAADDISRALGCPPDLLNRSTRSFA